MSFEAMLPAARVESCAGLVSEVGGRPALGFLKAPFLRKAYS